MKITPRFGLSAIILFTLLCFPLNSNGSAVEKNMNYIASKDELLKEGVQFFNKGQMDEAINSFQTAFKKYFPSNKKLACMALTGKADCLTHSMQIDSAMANYQRATALANQANEPKIEMYTLSALAFIHQFRGNYVKAVELSKIYKKFARQYSDKYDYASIHRVIADIYLELNMPDSARTYLDQSWGLFEKMNDSEGLTKVASAYALYYGKLKNYEKSLEYLFIQREHYEKENKIQANHAINSLNICRNFIEIENWGKAREYGKEALAICEELDLSFYKAHTLVVLGQIAEHYSELDTASSYYTSGLTLYRKTGQSPKVIYTLRNLGKLAVQQERYELADSYYREALQLADSMQINDEVMLLQLGQGISLFLQGNQKAARSSLIKANTLAQGLNDKNVLYQSSFWMSKLLEDQGSWKEAYRMLSVAGEIRDSLVSEDTRNIMHDMEAKYEHSVQEQEIARLDVENALQELKIKQRSNQLLLTGIGLLIVMGLSVFIYRLYKSNKKTKEQLAKQNITIEKALDEKEILLREIHHRVKNNLQIVSSLLRLQSRHIDDETALLALKEGQNRVKSMALIHQNLYQDENLTGIKVKEYIVKLCNSLFHSYNVSPDNITLTTEIDDLNLDVDTVIPLGLILNELITNALKYAFPENRNGEVTVRLKNIEDDLLVEVEDNGVGIQDKKASNDSFGHRMIRTFAQKLNADFNLESKIGTKAKLTVKNFKSV